MDNQHLLTATRSARKSLDTDLPATSAHCAGDLFSTV
jgi:hypothetical protein